MELAAVERILRAHSRLFHRAYIYGSVAAGASDEQSDVDLILIRETKLPFFDRVREVFDIVKALAPVDVLIYREEEIRLLLREPGRYFIKDAVARGIIVEGAQDRSAQMASASGK